MWGKNGAFGPSPWWELQISPHHVGKKSSQELFLLAPLWATTPCRTTHQIGQLSASLHCGSCVCKHKKTRKLCLNLSQEASGIHRSFWLCTKGSKCWGSPHILLRLSQPFSRASSTVVSVAQLRRIDILKSQRRAAAEAKETLSSLPLKQDHCKATLKVKPDDGVFSCSTSFKEGTAIFQHATFGLHHGPLLASARFTIWRYVFQIVFPSCGIVLVLVDREGWQQKILPMPEMQTSFLRAFSYASFGRSGAQFWGMVFWGHSWHFLLPTPEPLRSGRMLPHTPVVHPDLLPQRTYRHSDIPDESCSFAREVGDKPQGPFLLAKMKFTVPACVCSLCIRILALSLIILCPNCKIAIAATSKKPRDFEKSQTISEIATQNGLWTGENEGRDRNWSRGDSNRCDLKSLAGWIWYRRFRHLRPCSHHLCSFLFILLSVDFHVNMLPIASDNLQVVGPTTAGQASSLPCSNQPMPDSSAPPYH